MQEATVAVRVLCITVCAVTIALFRVNPARTQQAVFADVDHLLIGKFAVLHPPSACDQQRREEVTELNRVR